MSAAPVDMWWKGRVTPLEKMVLLFVLVGALTTLGAHFESLWARMAWSWCAQMAVLPFMTRVLLNWYERYEQP